ncbi:MAG: glycosyltransferase [Pseudomonadota bacterium]
MLLLAALPVFIWLFLLLGWGGFWRADQRLKRASPPSVWPGVAVVIPARNEAETARRIIEAHMASDYPGALDVYLVNDSSTDATVAEAMAGADGSNRTLSIVDAPPLEDGWSGKLWAVHAGLAAAREASPEAKYVLLTDADIAHGAALAQRLVARAEAEKLGLVSVMARLDDRGRWGGLLIPAFIFFFQKLYPFPLINAAQSQIAGAAGGVVLVRRDVLEEIGGIAAIRGALIDDCALAKAVKTGPPRRAIELVLSDQTAVATSLRDNRSYASIKNMIARTAFTQLNYSPLRLIGTLAGLVLVYLVAPISILSFPLHGDIRIVSLGALAWCLMAFAYWPTLKLYKRSALEGFALPVAGAYYAWFTLLSALRHWRGKGGQWKGRTYPSAGSGM